MSAILVSLIPPVSVPVPAAAGANCRFAPSCSEYGSRSDREARRASGERCSQPAGCCAVTRIIPAGTTPFPEPNFRSIRALAPTRCAILRAVMDTQRLILFVIFSFSALLLWDAWQKESRPPRRLPPSPRSRGRACRRMCPGACSAAVSGSGNRGARARRAPFRPLRNGAARSDRSADHDHDRPLPGADRHDRRDAHRGATPQASATRTTNRSPTLLCQGMPERTNVAQSGLTGEGMPNHRSVYEALPGPRELAPGDGSSRASLADARRRTATRSSRSSRSIAGAT
jgi:hypothetical protein